MNKQAQAQPKEHAPARHRAQRPGHCVSARHRTIAAKIITYFPDFYTYYSIRQFSYNRIKQDNRNLLLGRDPTVDGMKTGFTDTAG
jgi:D-alanyl-D-alanine carboxypeptidase (penicillin-binding protein 5/6)